MQYHPVVDHIALPVAIDPLWAMLFTALFVVVALATARRAAFGIAALIAAQPFAVAHSLAGTTVTLPKIVLLGVLLGLSARGGWVAAIRRRPTRDIATALAVVACVTAVTIGVALHRGAALRETLKWIEYAVLFVAVCVAYDRDPDDALLVRCWAVVALLVCAAALAQEIVGAPSGLVVNGDVVPRIAGPIEGPNQLAGYLDVSLALLCAWYGRERLLAAAIAISVWTLALTFSRGGIAAAAIGIAAVFLVRPAARRPLAMPVICGALAGAASTATWIALAHLSNLLGRAPSPSLYAGGVGYRAELWRAALTLWRRHPLLGVGAGNYELDLSSAGVNGVRTHANSWYLQSLAEGGAALFVATLALVVTLVRTLGEKVREAPPWQIAAFAASLALIAHQIVDDLVFYPKVAGPWWIVIALGASAMRRSSPKRS